MDASSVARCPHFWRIDVLLTTALVTTIIYFRGWRGSSTCMTACSRWRHVCFTAGDVAWLAVAFPSMRLPAADAHMTQHLVLMSGAAADPAGCSIVPLLRGLPQMLVRDALDRSSPGRRCGALRTASRIPASVFR